MDTTLPANAYAQSQTAPSPTPAARPRRWPPSRPVGLALIALAVLGLAVGVALATKAHRMFIPRNFAVVDDGLLYRSGQIDRRLIDDVIAKHKIGAIVFLSGDNLNRADTVAEIEAARRAGIERLNFPLKGDGTGDIVQYANAVDAMARYAKAGTPVLLHCHTGAQRTSGAVAFWRVLVQKRSGKEAYAEMLENGHDPSDNVRLVPYLKANMATMAQLLVERGTIDKVPDPLPVVAP